MGLLDWLFPGRCVGCGTGAPGLCDVCVAAAPTAPPAPAPPGLDVWFVPFAYEGGIRAAVSRVKYHNERAVVRRFAACCARGVPVTRDAGVTWLPTTAARRRERGFDHAELLARAVARERGLPARRLLRRIDDRPQTGRSRRERLAGPRFAVFRRPPPVVVLVDDVVTTGSSMSNAAVTLRGQGCKTVIGVAVARTLLKQPRPPSERVDGSGAASTIEPGSWTT